MIKLDLNRISVAGLVIGALAAILLVLDLIYRLGLTMGRLFGPEVPFAEVPAYMVVALVGLIVYAVGRLVYLINNRFGMPPRR